MQALNWDLRVGDAAAALAGGPQYLPSLAAKEYGTGFTYVSEANMLPCTLHSSRVTGSVRLLHALMITVDQSVARLAGRA